MFNRSSYDRAPYDRSATYNYVEATLRGNGLLKTNIVIQLYLQSFNLPGVGQQRLTLRLLAYLLANLQGTGNVAINGFRLRMPMAISFSGGSQFKPGLAMKVPFETRFTSTGQLSVNNQLYLLQHMNGVLEGIGQLLVPIVLRIYMQGSMFGEGSMSVNDRLALLLPLTMTESGGGFMTLRRIGALNTDVFELDGVNLQPGQTLIIDTDELNVYLNNVIDVDSVTSDSVFFTLQPGENEITFESDVESQNLDVTIVWQNRWL